MRLLLVTPSTFGYENRLREAFERIGHEVDWIDERIGNDFATKAITRLGILRLVPGVIRRHVDRIISSARTNAVETIVFVNPETLRGPDFARIRASLPRAKLIIYRWDSLVQKPIDEEIFSAANAIYSFDPMDCECDRRLRHLPLFHSHKATPRGDSAKGQKYELSFVGTAQIRRLQVLGRLCHALEREGRSYRFFLKTQSPLHHIFFWLAAKRYGYRGQLSQVGMPYEELLQVIEQSAAVVDIEFQRQSGLTMRTFEVVFSGMPLVTTNPRINLYDFSEAAPIAVFDQDDRSLPSWDKKTDKSLQPFFKKYSIDNWARTLVKMEEGHYFRSDPKN